MNIQTYLQKKQERSDCVYRPAKNNIWWRVRSNRRHWTWSAM